METSPLPFARGTTYCEGDATAIAALDGELEGRRYKDYDPTTGKEQELIVLKATADISTPGGTAMKFTSSNFLKRTAGAIDGAGTYGVFADPAFTGSVVSGDLFYAIYAGEASGLKVDTNNLTQGGAVQLSANGYLTPVTAGNEVIIGISNAAVTAGAAGAVTATCNILPPAVTQKIS